MANRFTDFRDDLEMIRGLVSTRANRRTSDNLPPVLRKKPRRRREAAQYVEIQPGVWVNPDTKIPEATARVGGSGHRILESIAAAISETGFRVDSASRDEATHIAAALGLTEDEAKEFGRLWTE